MRRLEPRISLNHAVGIIPIVVIFSLVVVADPRINSFPSLYEDDELAENRPSISKQTAITTPAILTSKSQLNGVEFGKRLQSVSPPASPAQIVKSIAASSTPVWTGSSLSPITTSKISTISNQQSSQKTVTPSIIPTKSLVMQNLATGEIYMKRSPVTNSQQQQQQTVVDISNQPAEPKHWSGLDNYLRMIRVSANSQQPYYQTVSDEYMPSLHRDRDPSLASQGYLIQIARPNDPTGATLILPVPTHNLNQQQRLIVPYGQNYQTDAISPQNSRFDDQLNARRIESQISSRTRDELMRLHLDSQYNKQPITNDYNGNNNNNNNNDYSIYRPSSHINLQDLQSFDSLVQRPESHISRFPVPASQYQQAFDRAFCHYQNQISGDYLNAKQQQQPDSISKHIDVDLTPNAYPSHMGIYNGSQPSSNNYLCGATWIHQSFAVTLASCLHGIDLLDNLTIQAGEWNFINYTKNGFNAPIKRRIKSVSVHPMYKSQNWMDNIALVQFDQPIGVLDGNIYPACQQYSRIQLRAGSCWAPARNITKTLSFDAEGDGSTKEDKQIRMLEFPMKLIPSDDLKCQRETSIEAFNFGNPGLICSNEYKQFKKRIENGEVEILGSGIYCEEGGLLNLVSMFHPAGYEPISSKSELENLILKKQGQPSSPGLIDLSYYKHWMNSVIRNKDSRGQLSMYLVATQN